MLWVKDFVFLDLFSWWFFTWFYHDESPFFSTILENSFGLFPTSSSKSKCDVSCQDLLCFLWITTCCELKHSILTWSIFWLDMKWMWQIIATSADVTPKWWFSKGILPKMHELNELSKAWMSKTMNELSKKNDRHQTQSTLEINNNNNNNNNSQTFTLWIYCFTLPMDS